MNKSFSIVIAYFNRKDLLFHSLDSINRSIYAKDAEVIIVDDASNPMHWLFEDELEKYSFKTIVYQINPDDKYWSNPCIPFNIGFSLAKNDIVILQNPETYHNGDILKDIANNFTENDYFSYACYSLSKESTKRFLNGEDIFLPQCGAVDQVSDSWFNHSKYRPVGYHFLSVISRKHLIEMGGFDSRYAFGIAYDDNEFLYRVKLKGLNTKIIDMPYVMHLYHSTASTYKVDTVNKIEMNKKIYNEITIKSTEWKVNK